MLLFGARAAGAGARSTFSRGFARRVTGLIACRLAQVGPRRFRCPMPAFRRQMSFRSCFVLIALVARTQVEALRRGAGAPAVSAPEAQLEEHVREQLLRAQQKFAEAFDGRAVAKSAVSFVQADGGRAGALSSSIERLVAEVDAGGYLARRALEELAALSGEAGAGDLMLSAGAAHAAARLLKRPSSDEGNRAAAGSLLTLLTGMPAAAVIANDVTGSGGHVEVVLPRPSRVYGPDAAMQAAGASD